MTRIDLDDLPPKLAALLSAAEPGEEVLLVQKGVVVGRLTVGAAEIPQTAPGEPEAPPDAKEIFEQFRSMMEDEF